MNNTISFLNLIAPFITAISLLITAIVSSVGLLYGISTHRTTGKIEINTNHNLAQALAKQNETLLKLESVEQLLIKVTGTTNIKDAREASGGKSEDTK